MARVARLSFIPPQLPSLTDQPPEGADWIHEVKHEGYRTMLLVECGRLRPYPQMGTIGATDTPALLQRHASFRAGRHSPIQFSEEFIGNAAAFFRACAAHELEGRSAKGFRGKAR